MNARKLLTIAVIAMLLIGGAAAVGAAAPADISASDESSEAGSSAASPGPDDGLPEQVPDRASQIHDTISSFLHGEIGNLGSTLGDLTGSTNDADDAGNARSDSVPNDDY